MTANAARVWAKDLSWTGTAKIAGGLTLAAVIAWFAPFDLAFGALTFGSPTCRAMGIVAMALIGMAAGRRIGLGVEPRGLRRPLLQPLLVATAVAVGCAAVDWALRPALHGGFVDMETSTPLAVRIVLFMCRAFNENILYRLFLGSVLVWLLGLVWKTADDRPAAGAYWTGFLLSQAINVWINSTALAPLTPLAIAHDAVRYIAPGMVWSWLYWRRGFQSCEIACTSVHLFYQPLVRIGLV